MEWLDELVGEHEAGTHDHTDTLERLIDTIKREHEPSPDLRCRLRGSPDAAQSGADLPQRVVVAPGP